MSFDRSVFWPAFRDAGFLSTATDDDGDFLVDYARPGVLKSDGRTISNEYEIEYQHADRPDLATGDTLTIVGPDDEAYGSFRVRQTPEIPHPGNAADGYFRTALLTKVA